MNGTLCEPCQAIFRASLDDERPTERWSGGRLLMSEREFPHHTSILDVQKCGENICRLCTAIWTAIPTDQRKKWAEESERAALKGCFAAESDLIVTAYPNLSDKDFPGGKMSWMGFRVESKMFRGMAFWSFVNFRPRDPDIRMDVDIEYAKPRGLDSSTWSNKTIQWAKDCITLCCDDHRECSVSSKPRWVPSRLLFVEDQENRAEYDNNNLVRIVQRSDVPEGSAYTTLSHCWGKSHTLCLTTARLAQFAQGIPFNDLPKTYADAITVTRSLGFQYIWIDSLCIIQDSKSDWQAECGQMSLVYTNGIINIAALHSKDSHGGCISARDSTLLEPLVVDSSWMTSKMYEYVPPDNEHHFAVLHTRGWVLQERILSPRVLQFGENIVRWQCRVRTSTESGIQAESSSLAVFTTSPEPRSLARGAKSLVELSTLWKDLITDYTNTALTRPEDKLVAFSGVARVFGGMLRETTGREFGYLAGLWEPLLKSQLLWFCFTLRPQRSRPPEYRAPSWSWAAIDGRISVTEHIVVRWDEQLESNTQYFIEILSTGVTPVAANDVYLQVADGYIKLLCWLWRVSCQDRSKIKTPEMQLETAWDIEVLDDAGDVVYFMPIVIEHRGPEYQVKVRGLLLIQQKVKFERRGTGTLITHTALAVPKTREDIIQCLIEVAEKACAHRMLASREFKGDFPDPNQEVPDVLRPKEMTTLGRFWQARREKRGVKNFWRRHVITIV